MVSLWHYEIWGFLSGPKACVAVVEHRLEGFFRVERDALKGGFYTGPQALPYTHVDFRDIVRRYGPVGAGFHGNVDAVVDMKFDRVVKALCHVSPTLLQLVNCESLEK